MCKNRLGYIFILPQTSRLDKQSFQDFHLRMTDKLSSKQCDYNSIINYAVDKLHDDGFGDFSPLLEYSFRVKIIKDIPGFIQDISTNVNSRQENKNIRILLSDKKTEKTDTVHINGATHTAFIIMNEETAAPLYNTFEHHSAVFQRIDSPQVLLTVFLENKQPFDCRSQIHYQLSVPFPEVFSTKHQRLYHHSFPLSDVLSGRSYRFYEEFFLSKYSDS